VSARIRKCLALPTTPDDLERGTSIVNNDVFAMDCTQTYDCTPVLGSVQVTVVVVGMHARMGYYSTSGAPKARQNGKKTYAYVSEENESTEMRG
jgi:hypothetical protein